MSDLGVEQVGKPLSDLPELATPSDGDMMYIVDDEASANSASKKITMSNLKRVLGGNVTGTVEGASVSFSDGADGIPMKECEVTLTPTQDLHGYSKPWAGGAGKNKYIGSPSFDGYMSKSYWSLDSEEYNTHEVYKRNLAWSGMYKEIPLALGTYTFSIMAKADNSSSCVLFLINNDTTATVTNGTTFATIGTEWNVISVTFEVTTAGTVAPRIERTDANGYLYISEYQLEIGSQATTFEPYANICPISGHTDVTITVASTSGGSGDDTTVSLGRTVYGGTLDVTTGELTVDRGYKTFNGGSGENWTVTTRTSPDTRNRAYIKVDNNCKPYDTDAITNMCIYSNENAYPPIGEFTINNNSNIILGSQFDNVTDWKDWLASNNLEVCFTLITPQTFTLTKEQIITLLGQNYVSHNGGGNIKVVYIRDLDITINDLINRVTALENE